MVFIERHIQTVKNMLSKSSNYTVLSGSLSRFEKQLVSGRDCHHLLRYSTGKNLTTRVQAEIDTKAIRSVLQERQLKMTLDHDSE